MRPEIITFLEDIPVRAYVRNVVHYPYHWHSALEIIYVLQGQAYIGMGKETHLLNENDIAVINVNEIHRINKNSRDNKLLIIQIDSAFYERVNPDYKYTFFYCCSPYHEAAAPEKYNKLKDHIARLVYQLNKDPYENYPQDVRLCLEKIIFHLTYSFDYLRFGPGIIEFDQKYVERLRKMYGHIVNHQTGKLGLKKLAQEADISLCHMSHDIKDKFGYTFQELLQYSRCEQAARLLLGTDKRIAKVSAESGFSDPKYLIKHFKINFKCTPSEFRKMNWADETTLASQVQYDDYPFFDALEYVSPLPNRKIVNEISFCRK